MAVIGGLAALTGLFLLYRQLGTLSLDAMAAAAAGAEDRGLLWVGGLLVLVGFGAKAGAFPLHIWLPTAHPAAPAPASAVLSGVITKTGIYGVLVLSTTVFLHDKQWGMLLAVLGAVTMVLGGGAGGAVRGLEADLGLLFHLSDRVHPGGDRHAVSAGGAQRPGSGRDHPAYPEPLAHQDGPLPGGGDHPSHHSFL